MRAAVSALDGAGARRAVHSLKSASANVGALVLSGHCAELERHLAAGGAVDEVARELAALIESGLEEVLQALDAEFLIQAA